MASPKLFTALHVLSKDEWLSFRKYLLMQTRAESNNFECFSLLAERKDQLLDDGLEENLRSQFFPTMSSKGFSNVLSKLFQWFEDWFAIHSFQEERYGKELHLIKNYNQRGLFTLADKVSSKLESKILNSDHLDLDQNETLAKVYHYQYYSSNPIKRKNRNLFKDCVDTYIKGIRDRSTAYLLDMVHVTNLLEKEFGQSKEILTGFTSLIPSTELAEVLECAIRLAEYKEDQDFIKFKEYLESDILDSHSDLYLILTLYLRRCSLSIWNKDTSFDTNNILDAYQIYFAAIEKNKHQQFLPVNLFNGLSVLASLLTYDETKAFIDKWIPKVHTQYKDSVIRYSTALNEFRHERYDEIPLLVRDLKFENQNYKTFSQVLNIIAMYKLSEDDIVINLISNFKKQLKRNSSELPQHSIKGLHNLMEIILILNKSRYNKKLTIPLEKYQPLYYKFWVLQELEKKGKT